MAIITKLGAAHSQLTTAIAMYFQDGDLASIHTLACAAQSARAVARDADAARLRPPLRAGAGVNVRSGPTRSSGSPMWEPASL